LPRPLEDLRDDPADQDARQEQQGDGHQEGDAERDARESGHGVSIVAGNGAGMRDRNVDAGRHPEARLTSGKAVSAALLLAAVVFAAAAVFLWVVFSRACGGPSI
jgi:hypothetical protein